MLNQIENQMTLWFLLLVLQAETSEDLYEWKAAFENALSQAPSSQALGKNGILGNEKANAVNGSKDPGKVMQLCLPDCGETLH